MENQNAIVDILLDADGTPIAPTIIQETESNGSFFSAEDIFGNNPDGSIAVEGEVTRRARSDFDFFSFTVDRPSIFDLTATSDSFNFEALRPQLLVDAENEPSLGFRDLIGSSSSVENTQRFDRLDPGFEYFVGLSSIRGKVPYTVIPKAQPIGNAKLSIEVNRLLPINTFREQPDVFIEAEVDGQTIRTAPFEAKSFGARGNGPTIEFDVDPNNRFVEGVIRAFKIERDGEVTQLDLQSRQGNQERFFSFDTMRGLITGEQGDGYRGNELGQVRSTVRNRTGSPDGEGTINFFRYDYSTFPVRDTASQRELLAANDLPLFEGTDGRDSVRRGPDNGLVLLKGGNDRGNGRGGDDIIDGGGGKDTLIGGSGDDILIGGAGRDRLVGGRGDDILDGGLGRDVKSGGAGSDIFVLGRGNGVDLIRDFGRGSDSIGLADGLAFAELDISQVRGSTVISAGDERLAVLRGFDGPLRQRDFVAIDTLPVLEADVPVVA